MPTKVYDFIIVGAGAAGLHLALAMANDRWFDDKQMLIIEKEPKTANDKTWCYWEKEMGNWDHITTKTWDSAVFFNADKRIDLPMGDYRYKMIESINFYQFAKSELLKAENISWFKEEVKTVSSVKPCEVNCESGITYKGKHVFDSRIDPGFFSQKDKYIRLLQHFKGWVVETNEVVFDPSAFTIMDFRLKYKDTTSFMYVLPLNEKKALIEFTFFSPSRVDEIVYDQHIAEYLEHHLKTNSYKVLSQEKGVIPMTSYPFHRSNSDCITKIGTAGSWVKASTGYSFKNAERKSLKIIQNLKKGVSPHKDLFNNRFRKYDALFLDVLYHHNSLGERIFSDMYGKNPMSRILKFLDEDTTVIEDIKIISSFPKWPFTKALIRSLL